MKKRLLIGCIAIGSVVFGYGQAAGPQRQSQGPSVASPTRQPVTPAARQRVPGTDVASAAAERALLDQYCVTCHNDRTKRANLTLEKLDLTAAGDNPQLWEKVVRKLRAGVMPPPGVRRPDFATYSALTQWLEGEIDRKAAGKVHPGTTVLHRLNRAEYANAVRDLLDVDIDPATLLPPDESSRGFDNIAGSLALSQPVLEAYALAAGKVARMAVGYWKTPTVSTYVLPSDTTQDYQIEGLAFGTRGGMLVRHVFPSDGEYKFSLKSLRNGPFVADEKVEVSIDGERVHLFDYNDYKTANSIFSQALELTVPVKAGTHAVGATFLATNYRPSLDLAKHYARSTLQNVRIAGFTSYPVIGYLRVEGPFGAERPTDSPSIRKVFTCQPSSASKEELCAKEIISTLTRRAYRRPSTAEDLEALMGFYQEGRKAGAFEDGIELALRRILASPQFLVRLEEEPPNLAPGQSYRISDLELASRLSFFLWSSIPDDELIKLAGQRRLSNPAVLEQQVRRMLADPRSEALVKNFAAQWLYLRNLPSKAPVQTKFPDWDDSLRQSFRRETELLFESVMREDRNVLDFLTADYTFLNDRLAKHYGIPNIYGSQFRRVTLGAELDYRRGLLGQGSILAITSLGDRTSPVKRGVWVLENILGTAPPEPPPNVPALEQTENPDPARMPTIREKMTLHRANEPCASCHKLMDPIGFALENFDADAKWRIKDGGDGGTPIDAAGQLFDGTAINGPVGLRQALLRYSPQFVRMVTEKLMTYGLGRGVEYFDMPEIRSIVRDAGAKNNRFSAIVLGIVKSAPFQMRMKVEERTGNVSPRSGG
jgi:mono/diheme cytochrome c family protein